MNLLIKKTRYNSQTPTRAYPSDAGMDLYSTECIKIDPHCRVLINTGIILAIPEGHYGRIAPRSGLAYKNGLDVMAGVIDSSYRNEIGVILYNTDKNESYLINEGDKIAQLIIERCYSFPLIEVSDFEKTDRDINGFGHTGV